MVRVQCGACPPRHLGRMDREATQLWCIARHSQESNSYHPTLTGKSAFGGEFD
jgi:hypothetical protein